MSAIAPALRECDRRWMSRIIVETAGCVVFEEGPRVHFAQRSTSALAIIAFVLGLLTLITATNGGLQLALALSSGRGDALLGAVLLGLAALLTIALVTAVRRYRRVRAGAVDTLVRMLSVDRDRGALLDGAGKEIAPVGSAQTRRTFQIGSSNRALAVEWADGSVIVARGSPFAGDVEPIEEILTACGRRSKR